MFVCTSTMGITIGLTGYLFPWVRNVERDLPDHDAIVEAAPEMVEAVV